MSENEGIFINKNVPYPNETEALENKMNYLENRIQVYKLKANSYVELILKIITSVKIENNKKY